MYGLWTYVALEPNPNTLARWWFVVSSELKTKRIAGALKSTRPQHATALKWS